MELIAVIVISILAFLLGKTNQAKKTSDRANKLLKKWQEEKIKSKKDLTETLKKGKF